MTLLIVAGWVICGVLAYGILKNNLRQHTKLPHTRHHDTEDEFVVYLISAMGLIGLIAIILGTWIGGSELGLCYRMPKELCEPRHPE